MALPVDRYLRRRLCLHRAEQRPLIGASERRYPIERGAASDEINLLVVLAQEKDVGSGVACVDL